MCIASRILKCTDPVEDSGLPVQMLPSAVAEVCVVKYRVHPLPFSPPTLEAGTRARETMWILSCAPQQAKEDATVELSMKNGRWWYSNMIQAIIVFVFTALPRDDKLRLASSQS